MFRRTETYREKLAKSAPAPVDENTEITSSVFDWLPFRGKKSRTCSARSDVEANLGTPRTESAPGTSSNEGTAIRRKFSLILYSKLGNAIA